MKFVDIKDDEKVFPGEYILHTPTNQIVLCGSFNRNENKIRVMVRGKVKEDIIENFQKILMTSASRKKMEHRRCKGCSG